MIYDKIEKKCSECKKEVYPTPGWVYKVTKNFKVRHQCSYTCWRKAGGGNKSCGRK